MSGPAEPSEGRAEKANQAPSGEYAAVPPTTFTPSAIDIASGASVGLSEPGVGVARPLGSAVATLLGGTVAEPPEVGEEDGTCVDGLERAVGAGALGAGVTVAPDCEGARDGRAVGTVTTTTEPPDAAPPLITTS
jgi:hypothetical protein